MRNILKILPSDIPPWFAKVMAAITTVPFFKTAEKIDIKVRPIGVKNEIVRLLLGISADDHLLPVQLGISKAGAHKLIHRLRMSFELPGDEIGHSRL